jgi:hypothetical protein
MPDTNHEAREYFALSALLLFEILSYHMVSRLVGHATVCPAAPFHPCEAVPNALNRTHATTEVTFH